MSPMLVALVASATALFAAPASAQDGAPLIPLERLFADPVAAQLRISGDCAMVGFVAPRDGVANIWVQPMASGGLFDEAKPLTDSKAPIESWTFVPGGAVVYFVDAQRDGRRQAWSIDRAGGAARCLTPWPNADAELLAIDRDHSHEVLLRVTDADGARRDVWRFDMRSGAGAVVFQDDERALDVFVDASWTVRLISTPRDDGSVLVRIRSGADAPWQRFREWSPNDANVSRVCGLSRDGATAFVIDSAQPDTAQIGGLWSVTAVAEDAGQRWQPLAASSHCEPRSVTFDNATGMAQLVLFHRPNPLWKCLNQATEEDVAAIRRLAHGELTFGNASDDGSMLIVCFDYADRPDEHFVYRRRSNGRAETGARLRFGPPSGLEPLPVQRSWLEMRSSDGATLTLAVSSPSGAGDANSSLLPHVLILDDAPWGRAPSAMSQECAWLASRGYAGDALIARGAPAHSSRFHDWIGAGADDLISAAHRLVARDAARRGEVAIVGHGFGGLAALQAITREPGLFACGIAIDAPLSAAAMQRAFRAPQPLRNQLFSRRIGPIDDPAWRDRAAPSAQIARLSRPFLVIVRDEAAFTETEQVGQTFQTDLPSAGVSTHVVPAERALMAAATSRVATFARVESFIREHLRPWDARSAVASVKTPEQDDSH